MRQFIKKAMDSEVLSTYDVEFLYGKLEEKDDFL